MAAEPQLDATGSPRKGFVTLFLVVMLAIRSPVLAQDLASDQARLPAAQSAFDAGHWEEAVKLARGPADQSPELDFLAGLALARLEKWDEAKLAFNAGFRKTPGDSRFLVELAGIAYKQKDFRTAKIHLHAALRLNPRDSYSSEFLATIYFLEHLRRPQPAIASLRRCAQRKLELGANFFCRGHSADGLEHAARRSRSGSALHCDWPLELERWRRNREPEFSKPQRPHVAR